MKGKGAKGYCASPRAPDKPTLILNQANRGPTLQTGVGSGTENCCLERKAYQTLVSAGCELKFENEGRKLAVAKNGEVEVLGCVETDRSL